jgi:hypothetical protein
VRKRTQTIRGGALRGDLEGVTPSEQHTQIIKKRIENLCNHWPRQDCDLHRVGRVLAHPRLQNQFNINLNATIDDCQGLSRQ